MDSLPTGWESDFDGLRWLYRYTRTGLTQSCFPKPGDEFPQFDAPDARRIAFTPEGRLAYEKQLRLRKDGPLNHGSGSAGKGKGGTKDDKFGTMSATGYFDPSGLMYSGEGVDDTDLAPIDYAPQ